MFGVLYGSVFGYEGLLHPMWMAPLSEPARMLEVALYWGIAPGASSALGSLALEFVSGGVCTT